MNQRSEIIPRDRRALTMPARLLGAAAPLLLLAGAASADAISDKSFFGPDATVIDFETDGDGLPVSLMNGMTATLPAGEYAGRGVLFDRDISWVNDGGTLFDGAQTLGGSPEIAIPSANFDEFELLFPTPANAFGFFIADNLGGPRAGVTLTAYDAADQIIDTQVFDSDFFDGTLSSGNTVVGYGFIGISRSDDQTPIARVSIPKDAAILDDLHFTLVPTPGAGALAAIALAGAARRRRRPRIA